MKVTEVSGIIDEDEMRGMLAIYVDDDLKADFIDGEPEDANMSRDFADVNNIVQLMEIAYDAGKNGEDFVVNFEDYKEED